MYPSFFRLAVREYNLDCDVAEEMEGIPIPVLFDALKRLDK